MPACFHSQLGTYEECPLSCFGRNQVALLKQMGNSEMSGRIYSCRERSLVDDWTQRWLALIELINGITGADEPPFSPPLPTEIDEMAYQGLRLWFMGHETQFEPLWKEFHESRDWPYPRQDVDEGFQQKYLDNPFLFFYEAEDLYYLAQQLDLQSGIDIWEPSEYRARMIRPIFIRLGELLLEFLDWIDKREHSRSRNESAC
jgi:hypothetical protein